MANDCLSTQFDSISDDSVFYSEPQARAVAMRLVDSLLQEWSHAPSGDAPRLANEILAATKLMGKYEIDFDDFEREVVSVASRAMSANISDRLAQDIRIFATCLLAQWCWNRGIAPLS